MTANAHTQSTTSDTGVLAPLRVTVFRRIWLASLVSNSGQMILGVAAAWEMTRMTNSASMVALVQTATMLPLMLMALPAGAVADMFDRRRIAMAGLAFAIIASLVLAVLGIAGLTTPWVLLASCFLIGVGVAFYNPAWQSSIGEQVPLAQLPAAVTLGSISFNVARSFGPAIGGVIVMAFGAQVAFGVNALGFAPLWLAYLLWQRTQVPPRLPPERLDRAIGSGVRYVRHSAPIRTVLTRAFTYCLACATSVALLPLVAKDLLQGDASTYGIMLGASGIGAVGGALLVRDLRRKLQLETTIRACTFFSCLALLIIGYSRSLPLTCLALLVTGACNILTVSSLNVTVQMAAPRWVTARTLSLFSSSLTGGIAIGAWLWGLVAATLDISATFYLSALAVAATLILGLFFPLKQQTADSSNDLIKLGSEPEVALDLSLRSGPVVVTIQYDVDPAKAREFYAALNKLEGVRRGIGGFDWSVSRNIADPAIWVERYSCPTWGDYLRMRDRYTQSDWALQDTVNSLTKVPGVLQITRYLERPYGSVRASDQAPDPLHDTVNFITP